MRTPSFALVSSTIVLSLFAAGCGGDDEGNATETTPAGTTIPVPPEVDPGTSEPQGGTTTEPTEPPQGSTKPSKDTITESIADNPDLTTLNTAIGAADLSSTLKQPGPYTVFAPNNDAFAKLGSQLDTLLQPDAKSTLANVLKFHVVSGELKVKDLDDGDLLTTLQGTRIRIAKKGNTVTVGNGLGKATIVSADTDASNGVVHLVDTVLAPKK